MKLAQLALATATTTVLICGMVSEPNVALADSEGCVSHREFRKVELGMNIARVHRIFDTNGRLDKQKNEITGEVTLFGQYVKCNPVRRPVFIAYKRKDRDHPWRVATRSWK